MVDIEELKKRIRRYNNITEERRNNALQAMSSSGKYIFDLIPLFLHYNHPLVPGYMPGNTPHGIEYFKLSTSQQDYIDNLCNICSCPIETHIETPAIISLYCMGSTSSIGQNSLSDMDVWVCHSDELQQNDLNLLEKKCRIISDIANNSGVEVNFFLVSISKFRRFNDSSVGKDNCGSALHLLLLEEFYRTSLWIAGKKLFWYLVSKEYEKSVDQYDLFIDHLKNFKNIDWNEWFDLGPITEIPVKEFLGSALWLMYKSVDSPFKAVLKILLMEVYSNEYPNVKLIAFDIRSRIQSNDKYDLSMDAYYQTYLKILSYLKENNDFSRQIILRWCFYLKISNCINEDQNINNEQNKSRIIKEIIGILSKEKSELTALPEPQYWKIFANIKVYNYIFHTLLVSYYELIEFTKRTDIQGSINTKDLSILSQKLSSTFDYKEDKIKRINLNIAPKAAEEYVTLVFVKTGKINRSGWYLYTGYGKNLVSQKCAYFHQNIVNVMMWGCLNGVIIETTKVFLHPQEDMRLVKKIPLVLNELLKQFFDKTNSIHNDDLTGPCYMKTASFLINVISDVSSENNKDDLDVNAINVLSFGKKKYSLVGSIDLIYLNSWGEYFVKHYEGKDGIISCFVDSLNAWHNNKEKLNDKNVTVHCFSSYLSGVIKKQFLDLLFLLVSNINFSSYTFMINESSYSIMQDYKGVRIDLLNTPIDYINTIKENDATNEQLLTKHPNYKYIYQYGTIGTIQYFFENYEGYFVLYKLDETNQLSLEKFNNSVNKKNLIIKLNSDFEQSNKNAKETKRLKFALPQYFIMQSKKGFVSIDSYSTQ